ncbi:hypothetical protein M902_2213 [Bacteriovorax sp. BAL6_X]|nr:hypothetical protein M902_2213 [Bacteriovorax sp. BAL6_X]
MQLIDYIGVFFSHFASSIFGDLTTFHNFIHLSSKNYKGRSSASANSFIYSERLLGKGAHLGPSL